MNKQPRESQLREAQVRIPPGQPRLKLTVKGLKKNERGYWALPEQFEELLEGGYTFAAKEGIEVGTDKAGNTDLGSLVSKPAGSDGSRLYLMKIRKDWYEQNQAIKQKQITSNENQMLNPGESQNQYIPGGKNRIDRENL
jgi:hypothetical protein